ncbi:hypothetical protein ACE1SV_39620 [Streptomyces sp. E-15]
MGFPLFPRSCCRSRATPPVTHGGALTKDHPSSGSAAHTSGGGTGRTGPATEGGTNPRVRYDGSARGAGPRGGAVVPSGRAEYDGGPRPRAERRATCRTASATWSA